MSKVTEAERYLVEQICRGEDTAWSQLVDRFRGRLLSFATARLSQRADAEDAVQETFIAFINGLKNFRLDCGVETYLFSILRRKIIDGYRSKGRSNICLIQDIYTPRQEIGCDILELAGGADFSSSFYARKNEHKEQLKDSLANALSNLVSKLKKTHNFCDLKVIELLYYCQLSNSDVAKIVKDC